MPSPPPPPQNPVPPDYFERFIKELEAIRIATELTSKLVPKQAAETAKKLSEFYDTGRSERASRPTTPTPIWNASGTEDLRRAAGARSDDPSMPPPDPSTGASASRPGPRQIHEEREHGFSVEAPRVGSIKGIFGSSASRPGDPLSPPIWTQHADASGDNRLPGLREGQYSAVDILGYVGQGLTKSAVGQRQAAIDAGRDPDQTGEGDRRGRAGYAFNYAASKAPLFSLGKQLTGVGAKYGFNMSPGALQASGQQLGVSAAGGDINIGPFGIRTPFNNATAAGIDREWDIQKMRMSAGISGAQAREIFGQLNARGFKSQSDQSLLTSGPDWLKQAASIQGDPSAMRRTPSFDHMTDAAKNMTQKHPELVNDEYFTLMDKATRTGGASLNSFNRTMEQVSEVATNAGVSFQQLQADMDAVGQANETLGGTHYQGQKDAVAFTALTKLPASALPSLMNNPLVQSYAMRANHLMPWEQGLETGPQHAADASGAVMQMYNQLGPLPAQKQDLGGGFSRTVSSKDRKLAMLHTQFPELNTKQLEQMIDSHKTIQARATLQDRMEGWSQAVGRAKTPEEKKALFGHGQGHYGMLTHQMALAGFSKGEQAQVYDAGKDMTKALTYLAKHPKSDMSDYVATQRYKKAQSIINKKTEKVPSDHPKVTIELGQRAKIFGMYFPENKKNARAGKTTVNLPFGNGATEIGGNEWNGTP